MLISDRDEGGKVDVKFHDVWLPLLTAVVGLTVFAAGAADMAVTFKDDDGTVFWTESVRDGECAFPPADPVRFGHDFASSPRRARRK